LTTSSAAAVEETTARTPASASLRIICVDPPLIEHSFVMFKVRKYGNAPKPLSICVPARAVRRPQPAGIDGVEPIGYSSALKALARRDFPRKIPRTTLAASAKAPRNLTDLNETAILFVIFHIAVL
jgi:hypothetical protein